MKDWKAEVTRLERELDAARQAKIKAGVASATAPNDRTLEEAYLNWSSIISDLEEELSHAQQQALRQEILLTMSIGYHND